MRCPCAAECVLAWWHAGQDECPESAGGLNGYVTHAASTGMQAVIAANGRAVTSRNVRLPGLREQAGIGGNKPGERSSISADPARNS